MHTHNAGPPTWLGVSRLQEQPKYEVCMYVCIHALTRVCHTRVRVRVYCHVLACVRVYCHVLACVCVRVRQRFPGLDYGLIRV